MLLADEPSNALLSFLMEVSKQHGVVAIVLCFVCFLFWRMIWKVWDTAMRAKDQEIERVVAERDKYQKLVFERFLSSAVDTSGKELNPETENAK